MQKHLSELGRFNFYADRDGITAAKVKAKEIVRIYAQAAKSRRLKWGRDDYCKKYIAAALSFRYLARQ